MTDHPLRKALTALGTATAHPAAFVIVAIYGLAWVALDPASFNWHSGATMATWLMTLVIQRAEHRDTQAVHAKLDELLKADRGTDSAVTRADEKEPEDIEKMREHQRDGIAGT